MEVHAPHEPVHTWRDFFTHLVIVTIGLFIALMMEAGVEWLHHRHIVREARANIRQELEDNHDSAQKDLGSLQHSIDQLNADLLTLHTLRDKPAGFHGSLNNTMGFSSLEDAAWRTARDTGALAYMPYAEVQRYSDLYTLGTIVNTQAVTTGQHDYMAMAPVEMGDDIDKLPREEYVNMMRGDAATKIELVALKQYLQQLDDQYAAELKR